MYTESKLYSDKGWLSKPIQTVLGLIPLFEDHKELRILDLGAGVGRNCIPFAQKYRNIPIKIDCVDILELAIQLLQENAREYNVSSSVFGITSSIEKYVIHQNEYDLIMAISSLEHVNSEEIFWKKITEIREGIRENGIVFFVINSNVSEKNKFTGEKLIPQFEINIGTDKLQTELKNLFSDWKEIKSTVVYQKYDIPRNGSLVELEADVVTYVVKKEYN